MSCPASAFTIVTSFSGMEAGPKLIAPVTAGKRSVASRAAGINFRLAEPVRSIASATSITAS